MLKPISKPYKNVETYPKDVAKLSSEELEKFKYKDWYVRYRYYDEDTCQWVLKIHKKGMNSSGLSIAERVAQLKAAKKAAEFSLEKLGWNPLKGTYSKAIVVQDDEQEVKEKTELEKLMEMSFDEAIDFAVKKKTPDWKKNTRKAYKSSVGYLKEAAAVAGINAMRFIELKRAHFRLLLDQVKDLRKLTPKGYNKYRTHLSSLLSELEEFDLLENNPVEKIKTKDVIKTKAHRPPTAAQRKLIIDRMRICYPNYYRFLAVSYACTLRPHEICALKIKDLIREEQIFRITPIKEEENSKTNIERDVIIPDWLMLRLNELKLEKYKSEWYIFSAKDRTKSFTPGARRMSVDTSTRWWRDIVKKDLNLNVDQYSFKKLAGNDMVRLFYNERANDLIDMPRQQMGHTSSKMTEIYVDEHKEIMNEILRRKMPVL